jgi:hypothetical protein
MIRNRQILLKNAKLDENQSTRPLKNVVTVIERHNLIFVPVEPLIWLVSKTVIGLWRK